MIREKVCPKCNALAILDAEECAACGHAYQTRFDAQAKAVPQAKAVRQTGGPRQSTPPSRTTPPPRPASPAVSISVAESSGDRLIQIQPVALRRLIPQDVQSILVKPATDTITLQTRTGAVDVDLLSVTLSSAPAYVIFKKLTLQIRQTPASPPSPPTTQAPSVAFSLDGVTTGDVENLQKAIDDAKSWQEQALLAQAQLTQALLAHRDSVSRTIAAWDTLVKQDAYLADRDLRRFQDSLDSSLLSKNINARVLEGLPEEYGRALRRLLPIIAEPRTAAEERNAAYVLHELSAYGPFFDTVESHPLTAEQREAIVHDEDNALVIAGAGTGKTSTIVGKVGYLLRKGAAKPEEILLLAFTKKAALEMQERIKEKIGVQLPIRTFHALGLEIIAAARDRKPSLAAEAEDPAVMSQTLQSLIAQSLEDQDFRRDFLSFQSRLKQPFKPRWEFTSEGEYRDYLLDVEPRALTGRLLRSYEECEIANWLFTSGIRFEYEPSYEVDTADRDHRQYRPDFFLPDYNIYIEHWGVDRNNRTASFMDGDAYRAKMEWAREEHRKRGTKLVETYSWEKQAGVLLSSLETKLREQGVEMEPIPADTALAVLNEAGRIDPFVTLVGTFLRLFKSGSHASMGQIGQMGQMGQVVTDLYQLYQQAANTSHKERAQLFLRLFAKLFSEYQDLLTGRGDIDFEDMIAVARGYVEDGSYRSPFLYILVDEFQDIAGGRANLIQALRKQAEGAMGAEGAGAKLFCVGDDWQSIYRFTGSNIALTTAFDTHFGYTRKTTLSRTFRFHDKIEGFSSRFVQRNPGQIQKQLTTQTMSEKPGVAISWGKEGDDSLIPLLTEVATEIAAGTQDIVDIVDIADTQDTEKPASVFLLARYKYLLPTLADVKALRPSFPQLDIQAMTAHASKGLEADYVILLGLGSGKYGFPSQIADDPLLSLVLPPSEQFLFAEERRLFYVALTRAKKRVYLVVDTAKPSEFVREILADSGFEKIVRESASSPVAADGCPTCRRGQIRRRDGKFGRFYSCSNQPICAYKATSCIQCKQGRMIEKEESSSVLICTACGFLSRSCPRCKEGVLVERCAKGSGHSDHSGRSFWGCSNYGRSFGSCTYTEATEPQSKV